MGNVPISCCRTKSPRSQHDSSGSYRNPQGGCSTNSSSTSATDRIKSHYGSRGKKHSNHSGKNQDDLDSQHHHNQKQHTQPSHILQHISEREPDDSETDPSSNPLNRPIFATRNPRATKQPICNFVDSYSSNCSIQNRLRQKTISTTPLMSSQDYGYNSNTTSTSLTNYDGNLNDSFDTSLPRQNQNQHNINQNQRQIDNVTGYANADNNIKNDLTSFGGESCILDETRLLLLTSNIGPKNTHPNANLSSNNIENSYDNNQVIKADQRTILHKSSSCSTIFCDGSTISQPNLKQTINCVSLAIYYHIQSRTSDYSAEIFDESIHPLKIPAPKQDSNHDQAMRDELIILDQDIGDKLSLSEATSKDSKNGRHDDEDQEAIHSFVETLFKAAELTSEYAITTLVYLERLMTYAEMDLTPKTWRRMFLGAILLSSKVWEDQAVWNVDYAQILEEISVEDINELESQFLELIQFNMNVPSSVYAKYYFHLRTLAYKSGFSNKFKLLTVGDAKRLEAMSRVHTTDWQVSPIHRRASPTAKLYTSLEKLRVNEQARAVLM